MASTTSSLSDDGTRSIRCLFSDIDGTLIHYNENDATDVPGPPAVLSLPPSATGRMGSISVETLRLASAVRAKGARLVLISGTRHSTFAKRLPFLPRADAYVIENGGRIFYPRGAPPDSDGTGETPDAGPGETRAGVHQEGVSAPGVDNPAITGHPVGELREDLRWRERLEDVAGPASQDSLPPDQRKGPLWDIYRRAVAAGFEVDTNTYYTMLRVKETRGPEGAEAMRALLESLPPGLRVVTNLGMVDICPEASGKHNAAAYLASEQYGIPLSRCASMGDDDNDIDLAKMMGKGAFITTFSSESVEVAAKADPSRFHVARERGVRASEEMLRLIVEEC